MALFYFTMSVSDDMSLLKEKLDRIRNEGANISYTIVSVSNVILKINEIEINVQYELSKASTAQYFWYLCDAYNQESLIILCDSPNVNENGKDNTLGIATYNRAYFRYKEKMIEIPFKEDTFSDRFNLIKGKFNTFDDENENSDSIVLSKCTFNNGNEINNGEIIVADDLYVSTNLQDINFKTIVKDSEGNRFINIGGVFYTNNVDYVIANSTCPILIIVPEGRIKYEWNANTKFVPSGLYDSGKRLLATFTYYQSDGLKKEKDKILFDGKWNFPIPQNDDNGFTLYAILSARDSYFGNSFPAIYFLDQKGDAIINKTTANTPGLFKNGQSVDGDTLLGLECRIPRSSPYGDPEMFPIASSNTTYWILNYDITNFPVLLYTFKFKKHKNIDYDENIDFSLFINNNLSWEGQLAATKDTRNTSFPVTISSFYISDYSKDNLKMGTLQYIGIQPGDASNEEILDNINYLMKKFRLDQEG